MLLTTAQGLALYGAYAIVVLVLVLAMLYIFLERLKLRVLRKTLEGKHNEKKLNGLLAHW